LNILLVLADAWRYSAFGGAEEPDALALTPRLDAFRSSAVDFRRAYAAYPLCTPSRISIQCGLLVTSHNVTKNGVALAAGTPTLASTLSALGCG
jgi:arylsulfatase A-like enzyme